RGLKPDTQLLSHDQTPAVSDLNYSRNKSGKRKRPPSGCFAFHLEPLRRAAAGSRRRRGRSPVARARWLLPHSLFAHSSAILSLMVSAAAKVPRCPPTLRKTAANSRVSAT